MFNLWSLSCLVMLSLSLGLVFVYTLFMWLLLLYDKCSLLCYEDCLFWMILQCFIFYFYFKIGSCYEYMSVMMRYDLHKEETMSHIDLFWTRKERLVKFESSLLFESHILVSNRMIMNNFHKNLDLSRIFKRIDVIMISIYVNVFE